MEGNTLKASYIKFVGKLSLGLIDGGIGARLQRLIKTLLAIMISDEVIHRTGQRLKQRFS